jgi:hypothetical protein
MAMVTAELKLCFSCQSWSSLVFGFVWALVAIGFLSNCSPAAAQDGHLTKTTEWAKAAVILGYGRANQNCEGVEPPALYLDKPPDHGTVCFRKSNIRLREVIVGGLPQCVGRKVRGVSVVYLSRWGYAGSDNLAYTVVFPQARHSVHVDLTVLSNRPNAPGTVPADISSPAAESPQSPGPMPECTALVS